MWRLPASRTKTGEGLDIPLVAAVVEWLNSLRGMTAGSEYVFPKRRRDPRERVPHMGIDTQNVALRRGGWAGWSTSALLSTLVVPIESVQIKTLRIEHATHPAHHVRVLLVSGVTEDFQQ